MLTEGDDAPEISATLGTSDHEPFELSAHLGDGPVVLAFYPAAFAPVCSNEVVTFEDRLDRFEKAGATVFGISSDAAYSLEAFREQQGISFDLISDTSGEALRAYGVEIDIPEQGRYGIANRAVFVLDEAGTIVYRWIADELVEEPDYDEVLAAVESA